MGGLLRLFGLWTHPASSPTLIIAKDRWPPRTPLAAIII